MNERKTARSYITRQEAAQRYKWFVSYFGGLTINRPITVIADWKKLRRACKGYCRGCTLEGETTAYAVYDDTAVDLSETYKDQKITTAIEELGNIPDAIVIKEYVPAQDADGYLVTYHNFYPARTHITIYEIDVYVLLT